MDIHEKQSLVAEERWRGFQFCTLVVCVLGILGNMSSLVVLSRHLNQIAGSRLLFSLAVADLGVVTSIASRTLSYAAYGNNWLTQVVDWCFLYFCYCSIYLTILLSIDRYLHTAKAMLLRRINYNRILKRTILAAFAVMLVITLPHLLGSFVKYHHGSHTARADQCPSAEFCKSKPIPQPQDGFSFCNQYRNTTFLSSSEQEVYTRMTTELCHLARKQNHTKLSCRGKPLSVPATKFRPTITVLYGFISRELIGVTVCTVAEGRMRHDTDFVKAVYLGLDLPLRYIIPCLTLAVVNIRLVVSVCKAQRRHSDISQTARKSLLNMPAGPEKRR